MSRKAGNTRPLAKAFLRAERGYWRAKDLKDEVAQKWEKKKATLVREWASSVWDEKRAEESRAAFATNRAVNRVVKSFETLLEAVESGNREAALELVYLLRECGYEVSAVLHHLPKRIDDDDS